MQLTASCSSSRTERDPPAQAPRGQRAHSSAKKCTRCATHVHRADLVLVVDRDPGSWFEAIEQLGREIISLPSASRSSSASARGSVAAIMADRTVSGLGERAVRPPALQRPAHSSGAGSMNCHRSRLAEGNYIHPKCGEIQLSLSMRRARSRWPCQRACGELDRRSGRSPRRRARETVGDATRAASRIARRQPDAHRRKLGRPCSASNHASHRASMHRNGDTGDGVVTTTARPVTPRSPARRHLPDRQVHQPAEPGSAWQPDGR